MLRKEKSFVLAPNKTIPITRWNIEISTLHVAWWNRIERQRLNPCSARIKANFITALSVSWNAHSAFNFLSSLRRKKVILLQFFLKEENQGFLLWFLLHVEIRNEEKPKSFNRPDPRKQEDSQSKKCDESDSCHWSNK